MIYLNVQGSTGRLYQTSKTKKEGWEEHLNKEGVASYRKYHDEVQGILKGVSIQDSAYGDQICIDVKGVEDCKLQIGLKNAYGIDSFAEDFITQVGSLELNREYRFKGYFIEKSEDSLYEKRGISIRLVENGEYVKIPRTLSYNKKGENDPAKIPNLERVTKLGKESWNSDNKSEFLFNNLLVNCDRLKGEASPVRETVPPPVPVYDNSDLPF